MKIILYKDVPALGEEGDIKNVANGYARNYLIPQKFAVPYSTATATELAQKQQVISRHRQEKVDAASSDKARIESMQMELSVAASDKGKLFGSVTSGAVTDFLSAHGIVVERKRIELPEGGIKTVGNHTVAIKLYGGGVATLNIIVSIAGEATPVEASPQPLEENDQEPVEEETPETPVEMQEDDSTKIE